MGSKGGENWTYECSCDTNEHSFTGAATSADMSHNFPLGNIILTTVMSKHNHTLIIFLLLESLSSLGFRDTPLLLAFPFSISFASFFSSLHLPLHFRVPGLTLGLLFTIYSEGKKKKIKMPSGPMPVTSEWSKSLISLPSLPSAQYQSPRTSVNSISTNCSSQKVEAIFHCSLFLIFAHIHPIHQQILLVLFSKYILNPFLSPFCHHLVWAI